MSVALQESSLAQFSSPAIIVGVNECSLGGEVTISSAANFSLIPGVNVTGLTRYYNTYNIATDATISVTLPGTADVKRGWKCKVVLYSAAATGVVNLISGATIASISSTLSGYNFCELTMTNSANNLWRVSYSYLNIPASRFISYSSSGFPSLIPTTRPAFFAFSGSSPTNSVNVQSATKVMIPWAFGYPGRYVNPIFFNPAPAVNTQIVPLVTMNVKITLGIFLNTTGGGVIDTFTVFLYYSSGAGIAFGSFTTQNIISTTSPFVVEYNMIRELPTGLTYEIGISSAGAGTLPTVPENMFIHIEVLSY
jgi:hypothetical protein